MLASAASTGQKFHLASIVDLQEQIKAGNKNSWFEAREGRQVQGGSRPVPGFSWESGLLAQGNPSIGNPPNRNPPNRNPTNGNPPNRNPTNGGAESDQQCNINSEPEEEPPLPPRWDTHFTNHKHDFTYNDVSTISTESPTRFSDMGYLLFGYDIYKGNPLTFGFDPGFRHPLFDHGKIEDYLTTVDGRHTHPPGTTALPAQACSATFRKTVIETVEDLQSRQGSVSESSRGFSFDGAEFADAIPESAQKNPKAAAFVGAVKTLKASHSSVNNEEYKAEMASASRDDSKTIIAEASCSVYQAKLNQHAPPPLLPEVKAWILQMLEIQGRGETTRLRKEIVHFFEHYGTHILTGVNFGARYMYNFTLTAKSEGEIKETFESFEKAVDSELGFLGFGTTSRNRKTRVGEETEKRDMFEETVEVSLKSVGAPLPEIKDNGHPDAKEWANDTFENPVPIKISHVGMENILGRQLLGKDFMDEIACKGVPEKNLTYLQKEFVRMLPRKAVSVCNTPAIECRLAILPRKERLAMYKLIGYSAEPCQDDAFLCSWFQLHYDDKWDTVDREETERRYNKRLDLIWSSPAWRSLNPVPAKCKAKIEMLANGNIDGYHSLGAFLGRECFNKPTCRGREKLTVCTKIVGYKDSYAESLSKRGGFPKEIDLVLVDETKSIDEEIEKIMKEAAEKLENHEACTFDLPQESVSASACHKNTTTV